MLNLIVVVLLNLGFNVEGGKHFTMNSYNAQHVRHFPEYDKDGGDEVFLNLVTIDNYLPDDIIIVDDDMPSK